ncbi:MAG TPA: glycosyltransferase family 4 protein [Flavobacterium sp.]|nr:glycosyltransferase family 4 protein [Flavobacterium sp.]
MRIGLVLPNIPAYSETFFRNKILGLQESGHEVILFVNNSKAKNNYLNCKVVKAPKLDGNKINILIISYIQLIKAVFINPKKSLKLYNLNKKDGITFSKNIKQIIANQFLLSEKLDWLHFGFGTMALERENIAKVLGAKMAVSFRGFDYYVYPIKNKHCYSLLFSKKVKYHVLSEGMKKGLMQQGVPAEMITKITPAIDLNLYRERKEQQGQILQIVTVARLHWVKGIEYTLEALAELKKQGFDFQYTIIGEGIEKERLKFSVQQLNLHENITFAGKLSPEEVRQRLNTADIYIQYSFQEGFCNAVLEAQAMGLLCIVSNAEGLTENVLDGETGWVVPKRSPKLLAQKIREVMALSQAEKEAIPNRAVQRVEEAFGLELQQQKFLDFYKSIV